jgi:hypothetical protein
MGHQRAAARPLSKIASGFQSQTAITKPQKIHQKIKVMITRTFGEGEDSLVGKFLEQEQKKFAEFRTEHELKTALQNQVNHLLGQRSEKKQKFEILSASIGGFVGPTLAKSCAENLIRNGEDITKFNEILDVHATADFVCRNAKEILAELRARLIDDPEHELVHFQKENAGNLKKFGIIIS